LTGAVRDQQVQKIKDRGILEVQDRPKLDNLAAKIFDVLWKRIEVSIDEIKKKSPESALGE
jgi:hypothetical protein